MRNGFSWVSFCIKSLQYFDSSLSAVTMSGFSMRYICVWIVDVYILNWRQLECVSVVVVVVVFVFFFFVFVHLLHHIFNEFSVRQINFDLLSYHTAMRLICSQMNSSPFIACTFFRRLVIVVCVCVFFFVLFSILPLFLCWCHIMKPHQRSESYFLSNSLQSAHYVNTCHKVLRAHTRTHIHSHTPLLRAPVREMLLWIIIQIQRHKITRD